MSTNSKTQAWFCSTGLPNDVVVDVNETSFHLHKFPLMAKSKKLHNLITELEENELANNENDYHITLSDFPGGPNTFEMTAKFSYTSKLELSPSNVAPLRCAGEVLEMTEDYSENNLVSKTERFLAQTVLQSLTDSIETLKSCEPLTPLAESLAVVERCIDSIASKVSAMDHSCTQDPWLDELTFLNPVFFKRLVNAIKRRNLDASHANHEIIESCLVRYAQKHIPGINRSNRKPLPSSKPLQNEQLELLETIVKTLPEQNCSSSATTVKLFFGMLRNANILNASDDIRSILEKKIGFRFEKVSLDDLLMPSYSYLSETLYDVDCVHRMLTYFLRNVEDSTTDLILVGKLIDDYLSEIALDANLKTEKFCELAAALPAQARVFDDGLYRSVDVYIKAHQWIPEADREKVCGVLDCRKLTLEACTHAAQNERLPLRAVVQVLFFEQLQLRQAIASTLMAADIGPSDSDRDEMVVEDVTRNTAVRENQVLRLGMESMRTRVHELERECTSMKKAIEKIDNEGTSWRGSFTKKFGCTFKTQVCDSHEPTVVETRKGRTRTRTRRHLDR